MDSSAIISHEFWSNLIFFQHTSILFFIHAHRKYQFNSALKVSRLTFCNRAPPDRKESNMFGSTMTPHWLTPEARCSKIYLSSKPLPKPMLAAAMPSSCKRTQAALQRTILCKCLGDDQDRKRVVNEHGLDWKISHQFLYPGSYKKIARVIDPGLPDYQSLNLCRIFRMDW